jgi:nucleoside transporter
MVALCRALLFFAAYKQIFDAMKFSSFSLCLLFFLQFGVWGCYLTSLGQLLGTAGLGNHISIVYASTGIMSLITPAIICHVADQYSSPKRMLAACHIIAAAFMLCAWIYAHTHSQMSFSVFYPLYLAFLAFFMPTIPLATTVAFAKIKGAALDTTKKFPIIRLWGTIGFIAAMWFVNCAYLHNGYIGFTLNEANPHADHRFQYTSMQLFATALMGAATAIYTFLLPEHHTPKRRHTKQSLSQILGFDAFHLFKQPELRTFFVFAIFIGVCTQISNGYATSYISHFAALPQYETSAIAANSTMLFSLSNISEAASILLVGIALRKLGIRYTIFIALIAWSLRFVLFAYGNPGSGLWMLVSSMLAFGIAFNFYSVAGMLYVESRTSTEHKALGQGLLMMMSTGIGSTVGMLCAGAIVTHHCHWTTVDSRALLVGDWQSVWLALSGYTLLIATAILVFMRQK